MPSGSLAGQDASLVRAAIAGNSGEMVSRWGHILLRRALASRLDAPVGMDPAEFAGLRAGLLSRMGEGDAARALVQDVDPANYTAPLAQAALDAYRETEDFTGLCPIISQGAGIGTDGRWQVMAAMCQVFSGAPAAGFHQIDRLTYRGALPRTDMLLMQKYAGAAGSSGVEGRSGRRAVTIAWDDVSSLTPLGYSLALAVGLDPPASVLPDPTDAAARPFAAVGALAPALGLGPRADASDVAGGMGVLSAAAMVDLYSQIFGDDGVTGAAADRALSLRDAYVAETPEARLAAMKKLWDSAASPLQRYSRQVLTAYAAARLPPSSDAAADAGDIIAAMLAAGLDANAARWSGVVESGSQGWALVQLVSANDTSLMSEGAISAFRKTDASQGHRKSAFLLAALAGLGRVSDATRGNVAASLGITLDGTTRWTEAIDQAAGYGNPALVALLAGLGMQGSGWDKMTPRYLYHIVGALNRVGLTGEARMIAAEAVARG